MKESNPETIRESVSRAYGNAVESAGKGGGCCAPSSCGCSTAASTVEPKGAAVKSAGYDRGELAALPADAVENSFGCGNPLAFAGVEEGAVVVDLGCGAGIDLLIASRKVGPTGRVIGVDMTDAMLERARANVRAAGAANVEVRKGLIEEIPVAAGSADWVISNCVINLSPEKDRVFAEMARVLKPGGRISISDIVVDRLPEPLRRDPRIYNSCIGGAISESEYRAGLERAGLVDVDVLDRIVYDDAQLCAIIESELPEDGRSLDAEALGQLAGRTAGRAAARVESVRFTARKP